MATSELVRPRGFDSDAVAQRSISTADYSVPRVLSILASLRLTVILFAAAIFLVFVGTLAQKDHDVWEVVNDLYFSKWFALVEFRVFERLAQIFNKNIDWKLSHGFYFPGGKLIGIALLINLAAAHAIRFKVAAHGRRLAIGLGVLAAGILLTYGVISTGMSHSVASRLSPEFCNLLWQFFRGLLVLISIVGAYFVIFYRDRMRNIEWNILLVADVLLVALSIWLLAHPEARLDDSGIRILWELLKCTFAGIVLLTGCVMVFRRRSGIVLLHAGVALMMIGQLLTTAGAVESRMSIPEGGTAGFSDDIRAFELAITDHSPKDNDKVTVIPKSLLAANVGTSEPISHADLPFKVRVLQWMPNSNIKDVKAGGSNPATVGLGTKYIAESVQPNSGVGEEAGKVDLPSAYIELIAKDTGKSLGTYLTSLQFLGRDGRFIEQPVEVDGKKYDIALRFERIYHPFTLSLKKFKFDRYTGTNTPKNYSSLVQFKDPERSIDREVLIWMNNPLRYEGTTFYQQDYDHVTEKGTVLQVVSNPSWMTPYAACMLVTIGMLAHFGPILTRFLHSRADDMESRGIARPQGFARWFPAIIVAVFAVYLIGKTTMPKSGPSEMQVYDFGKLPVAVEGRVKPFDTLARNTLQVISSRQELGVINDKGDVVKKLPAIQWLLDTISGSKAANDHRIFRIENPDVLQALGLPMRAGFFRYSLNELRQKEGELERQIALAEAAPENTRTLDQKKVLNLRDKLYQYMSLVRAFDAPPLELGDRDKFQESLERTRVLLASLERQNAPHAIPPTDGTAKWTMLIQAEFDALIARASKQPVNPATIAFSKMLGAYAQGNAASFNQLLGDYRNIVGSYEQTLAANLAAGQSSGLAKSEILSQKKTNFEVFFNQFSPFYYAEVLYVIAFVLGVCSWIGWSEPLRRASMWLLVFTFILHTAALAARVYISGRPPITNLYSTAIFIGWAGVGLALLFERIYHLGLGNIAAATIGFLTLLVAYNLSLDGDTFIVLQAVLDTQFWLATHVITVNLGYSATYLTGLWGILYILLGHVFPVLDAEGRHKLLRILYGTLCFAIFFSFVGTVLGGLWADDSWGRFWGWDPKENGALMIVLWNALVLHARWGGMVKGRGLANLVVAGNIITTWSYFGVNELGVGLHAYGAFDSTGAARIFSSPTAMWIFLFIASQLAIIGLGLMPDRWFESLRGDRKPAAA